VTDARPRILIAGGGFVGLYTALGLEKRLKSEEADIVLVSRESFMTYQPFLPEAAAGNLEPRHVAISLRTVLKRTRLITGRITRMDHERRALSVASLPGGEQQEVDYDIIVLGLGSVSRTLPVPGLTDTAIGFKSIAEAIYLRNQVLSRMDAAESTRDEALRRKALTFVFVGGGYAGVEALAELEDMSRDAARRYRSVDRDDMRWVLVDAAPEILPEMAPDSGRYAVDTLAERGVEVRLSTLVQSAEGGHVVLSNGVELDTETLVWTAGVRADPLVGRLGWPTDERGRVPVDEYLRVRNVSGAWAAGDCAAVPDLAAGGANPPTAQHALRQARRLAANLAADLRGEPLREFRYKNMGGLASLGRYKGVAKVLALRLRGFPAWFLHRSYHLLMIPTFNRKVRIVLDWTVALFFRRDVVQLGSLQRPRQPFREAAEGIEPGGEAALPPGG
jgi:NADH:ubiquinone reductase (H+-translocating)